MMAQQPGMPMQQQPGMMAPNQMYAPVANPLMFTQQQVVTTTITTVTTTVINVQAYQQMGINVNVTNNHMSPQQLQIMNKLNSAPNFAARASGPQIDIAGALRMQGQIVNYEGERGPDGHPHGRGKATFYDGRVYEGAWTQGLMHGIGCQTYNNGDMFKGEHEFGLKHGKGQMTEADGDIFTGTWTKDRIDGMTVWQNKEKLGDESQLILYKDGVEIKKGGGEGLTCSHYFQFCCSPIHCIFTFFVAPFLLFNPAYYDTQNLIILVIAFTHLFCYFCL